MSNATSVRVSCPACRKRIQLPADALHELRTKLSVQVTCSECGASRPVSVLRGLGSVAASTPVVSTPPFRPLLAPTAPAAEAAPVVPAPAPRKPFAPLLPTKPTGLAAQAQPTPAANPTPVPTPVSPVVQAPRLNPTPAPTPQPVFAPFAPIETTHGHMPTEAPPTAPSLANRWRKLRPAQRKQLAAVLALAVLMGGLGGFKKWQRARAESAEQPVATAPAQPSSDAATLAPPPSGRARGEAPSRATREPEPTAPARSGRSPAPAPERVSRDHTGAE